VRKSGDPVEQRHDHGTDRLVAERAGAAAEDDLVDVTSLRRKAVLKQVEGALGVRVREREVVRCSLTDSLRDGDDAERKSDPRDHDEAAVTDHPTGQLQPSLRPEGLM
jgi:hypothetical protein